MGTFVAILRGINVSGQKIIKMADLRATFETLGFSEVQTYVQSGNVVFASKKGTTDSIAAVITRAIKRDFGFDVPVFVKTGQELAQVIKGNPYIKKKGVEEGRLYVTFLSEVPEAVLEKNLLKQAVGAGDEFVLRGSEVYLHCRDGYGKTKLSNNFFEKQLSVSATTRNWKTVNALAEMATG